MAHMGDLVAEMLAQYGVEKVFGMPGGQTTAFHDGISRRTDRIKHVLMRDERNAVYAADAYARLTGKPGLCDVTVGPGTNLLSAGFLEALNASVPMIGIVGELPLDWMTLKEKGIASQGFDQLAFLKTVSKAAWSVPSVTSLPEVIRTAFRVATGPRPGPVAIIIPHDVFDAEWDEDLVKIDVDKRASRVPFLRCAPLADDLKEAAMQIKLAKRPAVVFGGGVHSAHAHEEATKFTKKLDGLAVTSLTGRGSVADTLPNSAGVLNALGSRAAVELIGEADLIVWCGCKASQNTALNWTLPKPEQATITIDTDPNEHGRTFEPTVALFGDVRETLKLLTAKLPKIDRPEWMARIAKAKAEAAAENRVEAKDSSVPLQPAHVMSALAKYIKADDIVISDASFSAGWIANFIPVQKAGRHFLYARGQGALGYSTPAAIGAAATRPEATIITVAGDGGFSYTLGELATQAQNNQRVVNIVLNNGTLGWMKFWQELFFGHTYSIQLESQSAQPGYAAAAAGLGLTGVYVDKPEQIEAALEAAFNAEGPAVIEFRISDAATPIHGYKRRKAEGPAKTRPRPGTVYKLRPWKKSARLG